MPRSNAVLLSPDAEVVRDSTRGVLSAHDAADGGLRWLDITAPGPGDLHALSTHLAVHPLVLEDSSKFGQRPKVEGYEGFVFVVAFGCDPAGNLEEVHCLVSDGWFISLHQHPMPALDGLRDHFRQRHGGPPSAVMILHGVLDVLVDSMFPVLDAVDDRIDAIEQGISQGVDDLQAEIFRARRRVVALGRIAHAQRDVLVRLTGGAIRIPGEGAESEKYLRDVTDHAARIAEHTDAYRDLLNGATEVHLAAVSNRLNQVMKQLTVISTIFLPLTFLVGFFGQNFEWMVRHVGDLEAFLLWGIALQVATVAGLFLGFRRRGWISRTPARPRDADPA